jgi:hypothetical protein
VGKPLVTFYGWDGKWWKRIKVGRAVWSAAQWTLIPFKYQLLILAGELVWKGVRRGFVQRTR